MNMLLWPMPIRGEREDPDASREEVDKAFLDRLDQLSRDGKYPLYANYTELTSRQVYEELWFPTLVFRQVARELGFDPGNYPPDDWIYPWERVTMGVEEKINSLKREGKWTSIDPRTCPPEQLFEWGSLMDMTITEVCKELGVGLPPRARGRLDRQ